MGGGPLVLLGRRGPTLDTHCARPTPNALSQASTEELLLELRRRIVAPRDRRRETWDDWDGGLDPDGDWPAHGWQPWHQPIVFECPLASMRANGSSIRNSTIKTTV